MDYPYQYAAAMFDGKKTATGEADIGFRTDGTVPFTVDAFVRVTENLTEKVILTQPGSFSLGIAGNRPFFRREGFPDMIGTEKMPVRVGEWTHVCAVYDKPTAFLYVNGITVADADLTGKDSKSREPFVFFPDTVGELRQVRFFDRGLTAEEIRHYMMETEADALKGLAAYFDFSRIPAAETVKNLPVKIEDDSMYRLYSKGARFFINTFASIDKEPRINPGGKHNDSYTVQAWVYFHESEDGIKQTVFSNGDLKDAAGMSLYIEKISGEYKVRGSRGTINEAGILTSDASVRPKQWVNLALTYGIDSMKLFIDGIPSGRLSGLFPIVTDLKKPCLYIGATVVDNGLNGQKWLDGCISRLDIWERELDGHEIESYAEAAPETDADGLLATYDFHVGSNINRCTGTLLGEHNQLTYGEISYPFYSQEETSFQESGGTIPAAADTVAYIEKELRWYRKLFMMLMAGFVDIVHGVKISENESLDKLLTRLAADSTVRTMFADTDAVTVSVLKGFYTYLYRQNLLNHILLAAFKPVRQWWKVSSMIAESDFLAASWVLGVPTAHYTEGLNLLAYKVLLHIKEKPVKIPDIGLSSVQFSHSSELYTLKHLQLDGRQNVPVPEWASNRTDSAHVAYIADKISDTVVVKAIFDFRSPGTFIVRCYDVSDRRMFGDSEAVTVTAPVKGKTESYDFIFKEHRMSSDGVRREKITLAWECWEAGQEDGSDGAAYEIINTEVTLYMLLSVPALPWSDYCRPDIKVLEQACDWAHGAQSGREIAAAVTDKVNSGLNLSYGDGTPQYVKEDDDGPFFELSRFMHELGKQKKCNSTDCAAITATFANALGCGLTQKRIGRDFLCNAFRFIGKTGNINFNVVFEYHDVCMLEPLQFVEGIAPPENTYVIYDACLLLNGSLTPSASTGTYWVVKGTPFSRYSDEVDLIDVTIYEKMYYREHLAYLSDDGFKKCKYDQAYNHIDGNIYKRIVR